MTTQQAADNEHMQFSWIGGATWILEFGGVRIGCDPVLCRKGTVQHYGFFTSERLEDPALAEDCDTVDLWLVSHHHEDHLDEAGLAKLARAPHVLCPSRVGRRLRRRGIAHQAIAWGEVVRLQVRGVAISVRAGPAIHSGNCFVGTLVGNGNGYLLELERAGEARNRVYVSGDDVFAPTRARRWLPKGLDLAIVNAGAAHVGTGWLGRVLGRITNDSSDLRRLTDALDPRALIATHWGTFAHYLERAPARDLAKVRGVAVGETIEIV
ncbi:MAG: MBL fold metallo-hydrolase [Candidatus Binataceae bacterium]